jgi:hypothetical protein
MHDVEAKSQVQHEAEVQNGLRQSKCRTRLQDDGNVSLGEETVTKVTEK